MTTQTTTSIAELQQKAQAGDAQAQLEFGLHYFMFLGLSNEMQTYAGQMLEKLFPGRKLGWLIQYREIIEKANAESSFKWLTKFAEQNCVEAQFVLAYCYYEGIGTSLNHQVAFEWFKKVAEQGNPIAQFLVARCYYEGHGVEQNNQLAFEWFKKSAEQDFADAQYYLAFCYLEGKGIEQDTVLALEWFSKSANSECEVSISSHAETCFLLAELYDNCRAIENNKELSIHWREEGEVSIYGDFVRDEKMGKIYFSYGKNEEQQSEYRNSKRSQIIEAYSKAYFHLAKYYLKYKYVDNNFVIGMEYAVKTDEIAENWSEDQYQLALRYFEGNGVEKSNEHGIKWMIYAAVQGHKEANNWLTNAYLSLVIPSFLSDKKDTEQYYKFAVDWCLKELDGHNSTEAYLLLGVLYYSGKGVEQSNKNALECFKKAEYISDKCYPDPDNNQYIDGFIQLYLSICCAQGETIEKQDLNRRISRLEHDLWLFGKVFMEGILAMPFRDLQHNKVFLTLLRIYIFKKAGEYELAKEFTNEVFDQTEGMDKNFKEVLLTGIEQEQEIAEKNKALEAEIKQKELLEIKMQKLVEQFTHTLGNVIFPDTIYQVAERLKSNPDCRKDVLLLNEAYHSEIIIKLQAELLRRRHTNDNPKGFRDLIRSCRRKAESGDKAKSIADILDYAASRVTARFLNQHNASLGSIRDTILAQKNVSLDALRQQFEDDILLNRTLGSVEWINQYLRPFEVVELSPLWQKVYILAESHAEALLFGYFSEVLFNAFKYADHDAEKFLTVRFGETVIESKTYLSCSWSNPMGNKTPNSLGTGKGLDAILEDLQQLNETDSATKSLLVTQDDEQFKVTLFFQKRLLINDAPKPEFPR
ncbi:tetratricopeptide repeat protein [Methylomonas methanica]|uniref:Sel1 domain protein repeat-containing protein n=1 Tax=Methylomonas methanica (strain DSM 25384 / MC09) TaxID=857087 RepID=F9ZX13_METMM|nr:SEL1-like repeat protein [Methylomonas methanica]AEF98474.1 Sel1 domain protein repeat-containing protein [Methylomonas methanica MC09]